MVKLCKNRLILEFINKSNFPLVFNQPDKKHEGKDMWFNKPTIIQTIVSKLFYMQTCFNQ